MVGRITGAYGVKGEARVVSFTEDPRTLFDYAPFRGPTGGVLTPSSKPRVLKPTVFAVRFAELGDREAVLAAKGRDLTIPRSRLPAPDEADDFYVEDLVGLTAKGSDGEDLGRVTAVFNFGAGDLLELRGGPFGEKARLIPFTKTAVPSVDLAAGTLVVADLEEE